MSLLNDALKQAKQTQQQNPPSAPPPLPPVESSSRGGSNWFLLLLVIALVAAACFIIGLAVAKRAPAPQTSNETTTPPETNAPTELAVVSAETNAPATSNETAAPPPLPPPPKLQGILYDPRRPWAIIDGKTVYVGDMARNFHVMAISRDSVTLVSFDETNVLSLGR